MTDKHLNIPPTEEFSNNPTNGGQMHRINKAEKDQLISNFKAASPAHQKDIYHTFDFNEVMDVMNQEGISKVTIAIGKGNDNRLKTVIFGLDIDGNIMDRDGDVILEKGLPCPPPPCP